MFKLKLTNKSVCVFGLPDSGKSTLVNYIISAMGARVFVWDTLSEYPLNQVYSVYRPENRTDLKEFDFVIRKALINPQFTMIVIDEANRYAPSKPSPLPQVLADLNDWHAHYSKSVLYVSRRPSQLNQDLSELSNYFFIFKLPGSNDTDKLDSISKGLGYAVTKLKPYWYTFVDHDRSFRLMKPVPAKYATHKQLLAPIA